MTAFPVPDELLAMYRENLAADVIAALADAAGVSMREAMDVYYRSALASQIEEGRYGIDNLDPKVLAADLLANEGKGGGMQSSEC